MAESYLGRFKKRQYMDGGFSPEAFECDDDETGLCCHIRKPPLHTDEGVSAYQNAFPFPSGDKLGVCVLRPSCFSGMQKPKRKLPDNRDEPFAELHCELSPCPNDDQAAQLAKCARKLRDFEKHK